jgi:fused signal recognition particle receptor
MSNLADKTEQGVKRSREGWFGKIATLFNRTSIEDDVWDELEELLIAADVGMETAEKLLARIKQHARERKLTEGAQVQSVLKEEMVRMLSIEKDAVDTASPDGLKIVLVVGVNGSGKTTSIAKLTYAYKQQGKQVILAAADTFRAAAIDQLNVWGERVGVHVVAHQPGGDPGAVVFDAIKAAQSRKAQVLIIDTAGRLHTRFNLMEELKKIQRVAGKYDAPQEVLLVIDATTGQNGLAQARHFTDAAGVTDIFLSKLDGTAKGGIVLAICDQLQIPISYIGVGEQLEDMAPFNAGEFVEAIFHS